MSTSASVFSLAHIALRAAIIAGAALLVLVALRLRLIKLSPLDCLLVALVAGLSVLVWRSAGNTEVLNLDPIPAVSPNDVIMPLVTYLFIGFYTAFRRPLDTMRFEQARVLLTLVSFIANTAAGTVEVVDGERLRHLATIPGCPEASGVLCAQDDALIFAAARGAGKLLVIDPTTNAVRRSIAVGSRPNGLAWDSLHKRLLVADVQDNTARVIDPQAGQVVAAVLLPGRPRWAAYWQAGDRFLVNIREPTVLAVVSASTFELVDRFPVSGVGPHGLDLHQEGRRAFVACDGGTVVALDTSNGSELARVAIVGAPDAIWHNHRRARLYVAIQDPGVINVVNTQTMTVEEQISTEAGAHTTAYDARRQRLYVFLPSCRVAVYEESEVP